MSKHISKIHNRFLYKGKWVNRKELYNLKPTSKTIRKTQLLGLALNINNELVGITQHTETKKIVVTKIIIEDNERYIQLSGGYKTKLNNFI